jgi:hypothetical protein
MGEEDMARMLYATKDGRLNSRLISASFTRVRRVDIIFSVPGAYLRANLS